MSDVIAVIGWLITLASYVYLWWVYRDIKRMLAPPPPWPKPEAEE